MKAMHKIVIKIGTSTLTQGTKQLSRRFILKLVEQIAHLHAQGLKIILVSSGAMGAGRDVLHSDNTHPFIPQILASVGQIKLMQTWTDLFALFELQVGQMLLTKEDFADPKHLLTKNTFACFLQHRMIPIVNENDAVAAKGFCIGNNDHLAALVAKIAAADTIILLTDQEGLYTADPRLDPSAQLISHVQQIDETIYALAKGSSSSLGTGGMITKIEAAHMALQSGIQTIIASSSRPDVLLDLAEGKRLGTLFLD